jgi:hypothetical protein
MNILDPRFKKEVEKRFPSIENFRIDTLVPNVEPQYRRNSLGRTVKICPPVVFWRAGKASYCYVLDIHGKDEAGKLLRLLQQSVEDSRDISGNRVSYTTETITDPPNTTVSVKIMEGFEHFRI